MSIRLIIHPGETVTNVEAKDNYQVALDGYVPREPFHDEKNKVINFNHHELVNRLATRATCAQVLVAIRQGMMDIFRVKNEITVDVHVNDCDQDVCLSWFLIKNHHLVVHAANPMINRLVHMEDMLDSCGGTYPFDRDTPMLKELAWIFQPYTLFRLSGGIERRNCEEFKNVIDSVCQRIMSYMTGNTNAIDLDIQYEVQYRSPTWSMIQEHGKDDRMAYWSEGIRAFVAYRINKDKYTYTIGRMSQFVQFDIPGLINDLNAMESGWGGSDTIGGSPRGIGSYITPTEMVKIVNKFLSVNDGT